METMEEMDLLIKSELEKCGIPTDNLDGAVNTLADFCEAHNDMRITTVALFPALIFLCFAKYRHMSANDREGGYNMGCVIFQCSPYGPANANAENFNGGASLFTGSSRL